MAGSKISGGNPKNERAVNDYYATNPKAVKMLLEKHVFDTKAVLEPCIGGGHIADAIKNFYSKDIDITGIDIVDRGYPNTIVHDFLTWETDKKFNSIITNPPYSIAQEFIEKGMELLSDSGQMAMFLKLPFLEGVKRKEFFEKYPPKYIYVFRSRMPTWKNGSEINPDTGKKWQEVICFAWFIWAKNSKTEPIIRWL